MKFKVTTSTLLLLSTAAAAAAAARPVGRSTTTKSSSSACFVAFVPRKFASPFVQQRARRAVVTTSRHATVVDPPFVSGAEPGLTFGTARPAATSASKNKFYSSNSNKNSNQLKMLVETSGGMEELQELCDKADQRAVLTKSVRKAPSFWKLAGLATIPLSAALGFGLVPSRRLVAHAAGAVVTGIAGAVGKSKLDAITESAALPALAQAILDNGLEDADATQAAVSKVKDDFGLLEEDYEQLAVDLYKTYLLGMVKFQPTAKTSEPKELETLKAVLQLGNLQMGEAHAAAAEEWYRQTCLFTPEEELEDPAHPDRKAMDKFLFLTERALKQSGETPEAFVFEMTRVAKAFRLTYGAALERVHDVVEPFYERALKSTRSKLGTNAVSAATLARARTTLGVSAQTANDMHIACLNAEIRSLLGLPPKQELGQDEDDDDEDEAQNTAKDATSDIDMKSIKFPDDAPDRLNELMDILELSETDANYEIALEVTPLFQSTALAAMKDVLAKVKTPEEAWEIIDLRRDDLLLAEENAKKLLSSIVMQALGGPLEETNKFAKVNNEAATYDYMLDALEAKEALISILNLSGWDDFNVENFDETFCNPWDKKSACGFLSSDERAKLYRIFLIRSLRKSQDAKLTDEAYERILQVRGLLGITDQQAEIQARGAFGPELQKALNRAMTEIISDYTPELVKNMQAEVDDVMQNYRLSEQFLREVGSSFYAKAVGIVSDQSPGGIPTLELSTALRALQDMFKLNKEDTYPAHMEYFGRVYKKSVLEAMGSTGVIRPEFRGPLEDLQKRLGVSEENCKALFLEAIEEKMTPMVAWIGSEMERTVLTQKQLSQRRKKDMGEDVFQSGKDASGSLGLGAEVNIMSDIMELIDFYTENDLAQEVQTGTETVEKKVVGNDGEETTVAEEVPVFETQYPVTALGTNAIDQELAELLYRQFVVGGFTTQGAQGARYESARSTFGGILGLPKGKMEEINNNIGSTVYDNFISNAMKTKGTMDQQDMMFLANIQTKLGLSSEQGEKMMLSSQKKILSEEINDLMDNPTPEGIRAFREKCNSMGMDLIQDVGISKQRLGRMFECEVIPGLKSGEIDAEHCEILTEIQESFNIEPEECENMFENILVRLSKNAMDVIKGELLRGREDNTVDLINEIVRYAAFTEGDLGLKVDEADAYKIVNIYESFDFQGESQEKVERNKNILRAALGLK